MLENPATVGTWGSQYLFQPEEWGTGGGGLMGFNDFMPPFSSGFPRIGNFELAGFPLGQGGTQGISTGGFGAQGGFDLSGNDATSGFSLASLGGLFGGSDKTNNGMGDLYNFLLALGSGKGGANGTNLFSGIEV